MSPLKSTPLLLAGWLSLMSSYVLAFDAWDIADPERTISAQAKPGQWTLLAFWALDCVLCEQQKPRLSQFNQRFDQLSVLGISIDGRQQIDAIRNRLQEKPVSYPNTVVDYPAFADQYRAEFGEKFLVTPTYLLYSPTGEVLAIRMGSLNFTRLARIIGTQTSKAPDASLHR